MSPHSSSPNYQPTAPDRSTIDTTPGLQVLMFGANWCAHCQAAQTPTIDVLADYPNITLMQIEDGKGRPLGRSYNVKLWPTLIFLKDGQEVDRLVRPTQAAPIEDALVKLTAA